MTHPFRELVNPYLGELLEALALDKRFVRGEGAWLWDDAGTRILDAVASYGALPFGHNPPEIWEALIDVHRRGEPTMVQPSLLDAAGELAAELVRRAPSGIRHCCFANSGAEANEAAIKAVRAATGRLGIVAARGGFHGKTLGALSATGRVEYQRAFGAPVPGFEFVPYGDLGALARVLAERGAEIAAIFLEPIQGEGGVIVPPAGYLAEVRELCDRRDVLLVLDEVQTGLGRTGALFAAEREGVTADVITLAKALGGGVIPIGACLLGQRAYSETFFAKHSSTFAGNTVACRAGLKTLELLVRDEGALMKAVTEHGAYLKGRLDEIAARHPGVIRQVRGVGLMLGVELGIGEGSMPAETGRLLEVCAGEEVLAPIVASYLLDVEHVRVAPTLNGLATIRIQPPLIVGRAECDLIADAVARAAEVLAEADTGALIAHIVRPVGVRPARRRRPTTPRKVASPSGDAREGRFAFLVHLLDGGSYRDFDDSLAPFASAELDSLAERWNGLIPPSVVGTTRIASPTGESAYGEFIAIYRTAGQLLALPRAQAAQEVRDAVDLASSRGARIVGLGGYTSIVTTGGKTLAGAPVAITTGNSYTVVSAIEATEHAADCLGTDLAASHAAVVGAAGSIGSTTAKLLSEKVAAITLLGNPTHPEITRHRLAHVVTRIVRNLVTRRQAGERPAAGTLAEKLLRHPECPLFGWSDATAAAFVERLMRENGTEVPLRWSTDAAAVLPDAGVIVCATSSVGELIQPQMLAPGAIVCDLSRPPNVSKRVCEVRPDILVIDGGVVEVPGLPDLGWQFGLGRGLAYACMSETMMLGLERHYEDASLGTELGDEAIELVRRLANRHGFQLAAIRSFDRRLDAGDWEVLRRRRQALGA